ncbi:Protein ECERIFERUM 7 [Hibiscus syriacus]|uniref:Protein ECERIFERUM 7 n=1 Tax=Hibiscus syriacus TaxID=106335 RepID=A0A6A2YFK2_HIBSY|nr:exosome complex component RRP45A-like isoform X2 [Hibiscus syriacus]KAE8673737.1 Protein ECERIFERUM 7 [Hibiscus syriacus]
MDVRLANTRRLTLNEKNFIKTALLSEIRTDGRKPFEFRNIIINFDREDGYAEVQLGQTRVMGIVTAKFVQPYQDRPNEGTLSIYTEFSPMADPSFEAGRPGESSVELGRIIDRGLRESRAVDTESLCIVAGKLVWAIRIDIHILDNGGNLVDAANMAALAALMTFRRPECSLGGEDDQEVIIHPPEMRDPVPLIVHHLPIAVTFGFFDESVVVIDPTHNEEAVMAGRMIATVNANGDICAIQKAGGEGVSQRVIMQCLQLAATKAADITKQIKAAVEAYNKERALQMIKREHTCVDTNVKEGEDQTLDNKGISELVGKYMERLKLISGESYPSQNINGEIETKSLKRGTDIHGIKFSSTPLSWDPYSKGVDPEFLKASVALQGFSTQNKKKESSYEEKPSEAERPESYEDVNPNSSAVDASRIEMQMIGPKTLKDAVKPKNKRKKKGSSMI